MEAVKRSSCWTYWPFVFYIDDRLPLRILLYSIAYYDYGYITHSAPFWTLFIFYSANVDPPSKEEALTFSKLESYANIHKKICLRKIEY